MADGRWVMTREELNKVAGGMEVPTGEALPHDGEERAVDFRGREYGDTEDHRCAFCGSSDVQEGFGGYGPGLAYESVRCRVCGGRTKFILKDEDHRFFE